MQEFGYPEFDENGVMPFCDDKSDMLQNITVYRRNTGQDLEWYSETEECAIVLIEGCISFYWAQGGNETNADMTVRDSCIDNPAYCLHVSKGTRVIIYVERDDTEFLVQSTKNDHEFPAKFYTPENTRRDTFGQGQFEGKAVRTVTTFFDYESAPYSNMVCGEILIPQGGWSSYPPHEHPQPEVYYYRFGHPAGFGACFIDDNAYTIKDRSFAAIPGGKYHPQVNAPGYPMMYVWMIRHFDGYPWTERNFKPEHQWLLEG